MIIVWYWTNEKNACIIKSYQTDMTNMNMEDKYNEQRYQ